MPRVCFDGHYRDKAKGNKSTNAQDLDIFDCIAIALSSGISYEALGKMNFVMLSNIIDALAPKKHIPTQEEIDLIT